MRLTCPNCGAKYEVDDALIPPEGRDVQCSTCSTTWFQPAGSVQPAQDAAEARVTTTEDAVSEAAVSEAEASVDADAGDVGPQRVGRREVDPAVRDLLRQEAEREERLRRDEASRVVETQDEMPLDPVQQTTRSLRDRLSADAENIYGPDEEDADSAGFEGSLRPRRELLPDIEEINSTLRSAEERVGADVPAPDLGDFEAAPTNRRGGRLGFGLVVVTAVLAALAYFRASDLVEYVPALEPYLTAFVEQVDTWRVWLDDTVQALIASATSQS